MMRFLFCAALALTCCGGLMGQNLEISGKVVDSDQSPLVSVTLMISGTERGTVTDLEGNFSIELEPGDGNRNLLVSYTGVGGQSYNIKGLWEAREVLIVLNDSDGYYNAERGVALAKTDGAIPSACGQ